MSTPCDIKEDNKNEQSSTQVCHLGQVLSLLTVYIPALQDLAFFSCECRGVKFYGLSDADELFGSQVAFTRNPGHHKDPNCVEVMVKQPGNIYYKLGHITAEAAEWLSPMLNIKG